ncbi:hypothetical protein RHMOL_Rhmol07G0107200 [Rhododendron molle]|uniref:Uncharacterized protein n=1 Tax=Rhododendron molle TaxID=49168 RepID=A0ACC0MZH0_RHOML|nr:hypothetical protein RHMOL_Rhmol07G0107200 [Rhododendron molle]
MARLPLALFLETSSSFRFSDGSRNFLNYLEVFEGERSLTKGNRNPGKFDLIGIPLASRGTGKSEKTTITNDKGLLRQDEIDRLVKEVLECLGANPTSEIEEYKELLANVGDF